MNLNVMKNAFPLLFWQSHNRGSSCYKGQHGGSTFHAWQANRL